MTQAAATSPPRSSSSGYVHDSELPLTSLVFLLPLMIVYELGTRYFTSAAQAGYDQQIIAFTMMQRFFRLLGVHGQHLPFLAVCTILLAWHLARREKWQVNIPTLVGMSLESPLLALPLIVTGRELARYLPLAALHASRNDTIIMSLGAGVYEELVFRLALFTLLSLLFRDILKIRSGWLNLAILLIGALSFSLYHYLSPLELFSWKSFAFRTVAGAYFGGIFLLRGFGITAATHAAYDVLILFF
jgi:CAAX prenyl protease-like protein